MQNGTLVVSSLPSELEPCRRARKLRSHLGGGARPRLGSLRISPHVYNHEADVDRFVTVFRNMIVAK